MPSLNEQLYCVAIVILLGSLLSFVIYANVVYDPRHTNSNHTEANNDTDPYYNVSSYIRLCLKGRLRQIEREQDSKPTQLET